MTLMMQAVKMTVCREDAVEDIGGVKDVGDVDDVCCVDDAKG